MKMQSFRGKDTRAGIIKAASLLGIASLLMTVTSVQARPGWGPLKQARDAAGRAAQSAKTEGTRVAEQYNRAAGTAWTFGLVNSSSQTMYFNINTRTYTGQIDSQPGIPLGTNQRRTYRVTNTQRPYITFDNKYGQRLAGRRSRSTE